MCGPRRTSRRTCGALAELIGVERILFGSDWPHGEGVAHPLDFTEELGGFGEAEQQRIMHDNAAELLGAGPTVTDVPHEHAELWAEVTAWLDDHWDPDLAVDDVVEGRRRRRLDRPPLRTGAGRPRPEPSLAGGGAPVLRRARRPATPRVASAS